MLDGHPPRTDVAGPLGDVAQIDVRVAVTFAREGEHRIRTAFKAAVHDLREVDAEEREVRIADRVDQPRTRRQASGLSV